MHDMSSQSQFFNWIVLAINDKDLARNSLALNYYAALNFIAANTLAVNYLAMRELPANRFSSCESRIVMYLPLTSIKPDFLETTK